MLQVVKGKYSSGQIILDEKPFVKDDVKVLVTFLDEDDFNRNPTQPTLSKNKVRIGSLTGKINPPDDFDEPLEDLKY